MFPVRWRLSPLQVEIIRISSSRRFLLNARIQYKAVRSEVNDKKATNEIRLFAEKEDFHYHAPEALLRKYQQNVSSTEPTTRRELLRQTASCEIPADFRVFK